MGRKVRALEAESEALRKDVNALKSGGVPAPTGTAAAPLSASITAELDAIKRDLAAIKLAGFGRGEKGERGDRGDRGEKGEKGDPGPMTYIAMPSSAAMPVPTASVPPATA